MSIIKIDNLLKKHFPNNFRELIEVIKFQLIEAKPSYLAEYYLNKDISTKLTSQNMSKIFFNLGKNTAQIELFLKDWIDINKVQSILFYDITSLSNISWQYK